MRNRSEAAFVRELLESARYEILPTKSISEQVLQHVPLGRTLTVTASMSLGLGATVDVAESLQRMGYRAVPHLAARMIGSRAELEEIVARLVAAGIDSVFVPAGDATPPTGPYASSLDLLRDLSAMAAPFRHVGIAGYPESHPTIHDDITIQAMWDKRDYATHVVSNLCFDPAVLTSWVHRIRTRGTTMPLLIGMPGRVERAKLLSMAGKIGVGESTRFLAKNKSTFARIATPGGYNPQRFIERITPLIAQPQANVEGLHIFTFNQVAATEQWRRQWAARLEGLAVAR
ncbi:methylenetetrahydrofolate reductase [Solicola gregarius]|uniref:Methylenetetrahydrofolate reductase n=1 Tax=Solicola gregarius TaxID=2908642 RepID=A0AA46TF35_9ACTN|nr:methylenetetrahydrofolate reductase [Solicola gregarius]UYM03921.1 methylenetetrahydrofolate reductase [Solicola gregarius]